MTNQQAPEIYTLHTVPNKGERPWSGIYTVRADAEHDAKVMHDVTGRDWSVVRLVVADTAATPTGPITRYEVVDCIDSKHVPAVIPNGAGPWVRYEDHAAALCRLHAENEALRATHVQNPAEIEHVAGDVSKNGAEVNMSTQQPAPATQQAPQQKAQEPCPTCAALARTVMLDQVSFDRKPDCYGIRQITDDEGVEEWEDIRTSPDVAREEANDMMATGRGEIYEVVPLWTTPQHSPTAQAADSAGRDAEPLTPGTLERFAALVAAREREACAQVCDAEAERALFNWRNDLPSNQKFWNGGEQLASACAAAIRARSTE